MSKGFLMLINRTHAGSLEQYLSCTCSSSLRASINAVVQYDPMLSPILWEYSVPRLIEWFWLLIFNCFSSNIESNKNEVVYYMSCSCNEFCNEVVSGHFLSCPDALKKKTMRPFSGQYTWIQTESYVANNALWFLHVLPKITYNVVILQSSIRFVAVLVRKHFRFR